MHRIDGSGTAVALPTPAGVGSTVGYFTQGDPNTGVPATVVTADWLNATQEEIAYIIEQSGIALDKTVRTQLKSAIDKMLSGGGVASKAFADSPYTMTSSLKNAAIDTSGGNVTVNLPAAAGVTGQIFTVTKTTGDANTVTVDANGAELINGELVQVIDQQYTALRFLSIGTGWVIL